MRQRLPPFLLLVLLAVLAACGASEPDADVFGSFTATVEGPHGTVTISGTALARQEPGGAVIAPDLPLPESSFVITLLEGTPDASPTASSRMFIFSRSGEEVPAPGAYPLSRFFSPDDPDDGKADEAFAASYIDPAMAGDGRLYVEGGTLTLDVVTASTIRGKFSFEAVAGNVPYTARGAFEAARLEGPASR